MKTIFNKTTLYALLAAGLLASCINDDDYKTPTLACEETSLVKNMEPQAVTATAVATQYKGDGIIEAYVTSSDLGGNFFKSISFQTLDGSFGFSVPVDVASYASKFEPGRKVLIKLDGTFVDFIYGSTRIGASFEGAVGRLTASDYAKVLNRSCTVVSEEELVQKVTITEALNDKRINTLIELQDVQFAASEVDKPYYDLKDKATIGGATNRYIEDASGKRIIFRTSSFATFAGSVAPKGSGTVRGVLTRFRDDYQFVARYESDIKLDKPRIGEDPTTPTNPTTPGASATALGGTAVSYAGTITETFESFAAAATTFAPYVNDYTLGDRYWQVKQFPATGATNKFIEMTSFSGATNPGVAAKSYFFVPADFTAANTFSFDKEIRFMKGQALKVYYVTAANYTVKNTFDVSKFVDITSSFTGLTYPADGQSQNTFTTAGTYNLPASLTGNGFFVFEYTGTATVTTTIQIDNISVK